MKAWITLCGLTALLGCSEMIDHPLPHPDAHLSSDATAPDVDGGADAGSEDAALGDAGLGDSGEDAGAMDAGAVDAGFSDVGGGPDAQGSDRDLGSGNIEIWVRGDLTPKTFNDGWAGQTPEAQTFSIGRLDLLRTATDTRPVVAFDHGQRPIPADMLGRTLVGRVSSASIAAGTYRWGRVLLTSVELRVRATAHIPGLGFGVPGTITTIGALSNTELNGTPWMKGRAEYRFESAGQSYTIPGILPPFPSTSGGSIVETSTATWLLFPFSTAFRVDPANTQPQSSTIVYDVYESFRWEDQTTAGFTVGVFDLDGASRSTEPVHQVGATNYRTEP